MASGRVGDVAERVTTLGSVVHIMETGHPLYDEPSAGGSEA